MQCAWKELLAILPQKFKSDVDKYGKNQAQEVRLRLGQAPQITLPDRWVELDGKTGVDDLAFVINSASRYSPWAVSTMRRGYITAPGGHRIGLCGEVYGGGGVMGVRDVTSVNIRVARDFEGIAPKSIRGNVLILGPPGSGKTTFLRDLCRTIGETEVVTVVDEREELFPNGFRRGVRMDVLTGCTKKDGIDMAIRTMGPGHIAVDEITHEEDCAALKNAAGCGVALLATAHGASKEDLSRREVYSSLLKMGLFDTLVVLRRDKSWILEELAVRL